MITESVRVVSNERSLSTIIHNLAMTDMRL